MKTFQLPIDKIIIQLGYKSSGNFFMSNQFQNAPLSPQSKRILKEINPYAVYIVDNAPFVLFFDKLVNDDISFKKISKQVWNAQIPVAIFCDESTVKIFNGLSLDVSNYMLKQIERRIAMKSRIFPTGRFLIQFSGTNITKFIQKLN